jgi:putative flippase GtrA
MHDHVAGGARPLGLYRRTLGGLMDVNTRQQITKWLLAGLGFMGINAAFLFVLVDLLALSIPVATLISAEACTLLRFLVNHYWVFGLAKPTLRKCAHYHLVNLLAFVLWWVIANLLAGLGLHYQLASIAALSVSTLVSLMTNFFWIWRHRELGKIAVKSSRI